jgi:small subunit ribosomal protein S17
MPKKKTDEVEETTETTVENTVENTEETVETAVEAAAETEAVAEKAAPKKAKADSAKKSAKAKADKEPAKKAADGDAPVALNKGKRMEKIGFVASDKMTNTVTVRVDRLVKHPVYRKYVRKRKKFMAHDDLGSKIGDKVRIIETRPMSARKRWRVIEIIQKAER